jgi:nucleotide-binding universal stress UspA family protein
MIRRVLHPSDFSKASSAAFKKAVEMAKADRAELMVVHVVNPIVPVVGEG